MVGSRFRWICLPVLLLLVSVGAGPAVAGDGGTALVAADVFDLQLNIDTTLNVQGPTRFFSSRPNRYVGGRIVAHTGHDPDKFFDKGTLFGLVWGKSSYLLNWEEPGIRSFQPLDTSISTLAMPLGMDFNLHLSRLLTVAPYVSGKLMWHHINIEIDNTDFSGNAFKMGVDAGVKVTLNVGRKHFAAGAGLTHIINGDIKFDVDDLNFHSTTSGSSPEYFLGMEL